MKKTIITLALVTAFFGAQMNTAQAHDRGCNPVGAVIGGLLAGAIIADAVAPRPVYYAPAPQPVYYQPQAVYVPAPVYYAAPQPVYYAQPTVSIRFGDGWGWGRHYGRGYDRCGWR